MKYTTPTKDDIKRVFRSANANGHEISKMVLDYFKANCKQIVPAIATAPDSSPDLIEFAEKLFNNVDTPGGAIA